MDNGNVINADRILRSFYSRDRLDRTARAGQSGHDSQDRTAGTGQQEQNSQDRRA
jgi:hypothetical protein